MLEKKRREKRSVSHQDDAAALPYNPQDWNRRLAEARARRAAALGKERPQGASAMSPSQVLAQAWDGDGEELAVVTGPIVGSRATSLAMTKAEPASEAKAEPALEAEPEPESDAPPSQPWPRPGPAAMLLAGCLIGSTLTGILFLASGPAPLREAIGPSAGALLATAAGAIEEQPAEAGAGGASHVEAADDRDEARTAGTGDARPVHTSPTPAGQSEDAAAPTAPHGEEPEPQARMASADGALPANSVRPPEPPPALAPADALAVDATPATGPERHLEAPSMVNAPQVQYNAVPAAPASIERVVIHAPRSVSAAGRSEAAALLREAGWPARDPGSSPFTIASTHVRYYHPGDREGAERLAALFSAEARDFTSYSPRPPSGMIELWLAGRSPQRVTQPQGPSLVRFLGRIAAALEGRG